MSNILLQYVFHTNISDYYAQLENAERETASLRQEMATLVEQEKANNHTLENLKKLLEQAESNAQQNDKQWKAKWDDMENDREVEKLKYEQIVDDLTSQIDELSAQLRKETVQREKDGKLYQHDRENWEEQKKKIQQQANNIEVALHETENELESLRQDTVLKIKQINTQWENKMDKLQQRLEAKKMKMKKVWHSVNIHALSRPHITLFLWYRKKMNLRDVLQN